MRKAKRNPPSFEGMPVRDAKKGITLVIQPADIKHAKPKDPARCAAAVACARQLDSRDVRVFVSRIYVRKQDHWERYMTPESIRREIVAFDRKAAFEPGLYSVRVASASEQLGNNRGPATEGGGKPRSKPFHVTAGIRPRGPYGQALHKTLVAA